MDVVHKVQYPLCTEAVVLEAVFTFQRHILA